LTLNDQRCAQRAQQAAKANWQQWQKQTSMWVC
jgi:hypothetical protein